MATESTRKNKRSNTKQTVKKLDSLIEKVKSKPVFVIGKNDVFYTVVNYITNEVAVDFIPTKLAAERITNRYNNKNAFSPTQKKKVAECLQGNLKLHTDIIFYEHTIKNTTDLDYKTVLLSRHKEAKIFKQKFTRDLLKLI